MRIRIVLAAAVVAASLPLGSSLHAQEKVSCSNIGSNRIQCRISQPTVTKATTNYQQIPLHYGDRVRISAGGCVQTGGSGPTWKLYVNPQGPNSDRLYYGLVYLPGFQVDPDSDSALNGFRRLSTTIDRDIEIQNPPCPPRADCVMRTRGDVVGSLRLGYADDDYHDNGYWGHDDGTGGQCRGQGPAWVTVTIERYATSPTPTETVGPNLSGSWRFTIVSSVSGRTYTGTMRLTMNGSQITGTLQGPEISPSPLNGEYDVPSSTLRLTRDTGLQTLQVYELRASGNKFAGRFHNEGKYPDEGTIEIMQ
jgi:hypothetical protein